MAAQNCPLTDRDLSWVHNFHGPNFYMVHLSTNYTHSRRSRKRRRTICRADRGESEDDFGDEASLTRRRDVVWRSPSRRDVQGRNEISLGARTDLPRRRRFVVGVERVIFTGAVFGCVPKSNNARCYSGRVKNCQRLFDAFGREKSEKFARHKHVRSTDSSRQSLSFGGNEQVIAH